MQQLYLQGFENLAGKSVINISLFRHRLERNGEQKIIFMLLAIDCNYPEVRQPKPNKTARYLFFERSVCIRRKAKIDFK